jgi:hypothetical protein
MIDPSQQQQRNAYQIVRGPQTYAELYHFLRAVWGVTIPSVRVCPDHSTPFAALAEAYFAETTISVWEASRGFGGKTQLLALLALMEATTLHAQVAILGGSGAQSLRAYEATREGWSSANSPKALLAKEPTRFMTALKTNAWIETLLASQRSVRGIHPNRLRLDEVDEMDLPIFNAALGTQMMGKRGLQTGLQTHVVVSSTHQYPDGTFTYVLREAQTRNWSVHKWCFKETSNPIDGWLTQAEIARKKSEVPQAMWDAEYELQEPSFEGRAFNTVAVEGAFVGEEFDTDKWAIRPAEHRLHITGIDWAKEVDLTVMSTFDTQNVDVTVEGEKVWHCVAFEYSRRVPWPAQVSRAEARYRAYPGYLGHDATGLGNVLVDYFDADLRRANRERILDVVLSGGNSGGGIAPNVYGKVTVSRATLFSDYIAAVENGLVKYPRIKLAYDEHRYCTMDNLFGKGHPPDSVVAGAIAWAQRGKIGQTLPPAPIAHSRTNPFDIAGQPA